MSRRAPYERSLIGVFAVSTAMLIAQMSNGAAQPKKEVVEVTRNDFGRRVALEPILHWPAGSGPFGLVIVVNSSSGAEDVFLTESWPVMNKAGIAVAALDTFKPRGVTDTVADQSKVTTTQMILDAFAVAEVLRRDPRVKAGKVAIMGQSKGAVAAMHAVTAGFRGFVAGFSPVTAPPFDAAIALAPGCQFQFRDPKLTSPLLAILGEKDDYTAPQPCIKYFGIMKAAAQPITWEVVANASHSWSTRGTRFVSHLWTARKCSDEPLFYVPSGFQSSKDGRFFSFAESYKHCGALGATVGGPGDKRGYVLGQAVKWLKSQPGW